MARSPRLFIPGAVYHVYCRTARGEMVFSDHTEATEFVDTIADVKRLHGFLVLAWCLLGNHYHPVVRTRDTPLWRSMARIQCRIARKGTGHSLAMFWFGARRFPHREGTAEILCDKIISECLVPFCLVPFR